MPVSSKIIVKVGKSSKTKFRGVQTFRAVTLDELDRLAELNPDASIVIVENIKQSDDSKLKAFISKFESANSNNKVFFYVANNDDTTCGVADELAYDIYLNINDLYRAIKVNCGLNVDIDISMRSEFGADDGFETGFDNDFDKNFEDALAAITPSVVEELPSIETKDDITDDIELNESIIDEIEQQEKTEAQTVKTETIDKKDNASNESNDGNEGRPNLIKTQTPTTEATTAGVISDTQMIEQANKIAEMERATDNYREEVVKLKAQLQLALSKTNSLSELVKAIEVERDQFKGRLKLYNESIVLEEPISLVQYQELEDKLVNLSENREVDTKTAEKVVELTRSLEKAEDNYSNTKKQLTEYKGRLSESATKLSDANIKLATSLAEIEQLKVELEESKSGLSKQDSADLDIAKTELKVAQETVDDLTSKVGTLEFEVTNYKNQLDKLKENTSDIDRIRDELQSKLDREILERNFLVSTLFNAVTKIEELTDKLTGSQEAVEKLNESIEVLKDDNRTHQFTINNLNSKLDRLENEEKRANELAEEIKINNEKIADLENAKQEFESRLKIAHSFAKEELDKAKRETDDWKSKYDITQRQLSEKEQQYNNMIQKVGTSQDGIEELVKNNETAEADNVRLREQVESLRRDVSKANNDRATAQQALIDLREKARNGSVNSNLSNIDTGGGTGAAYKSYSIKPFKYSSTGQIISVFGCGSFGITTTAMSIANRLSTQYKVLYIDFDMVAPKADSWFKINPMIKNIPNADQLSTKATGLGLWVEKRTQYIMDNAPAIFSRPVQTKSGCVDYLSGFYTKPDTEKLMGSDFGTLLNYCGKMYQYIVVDFGRLGSSEINDQIIKALSDVSFRSVVVTTSDKFEIRTFRMKMAEAKLDINNVAWLVNMCERTNLEDTAKKAISPAMYSLMPMNMELYGKKLDFTKDRLTRDKLSLFLEQVVFRK